jgi:hypothetical protein
MAYLGGGRPLRAKLSDGEDAELLVYLVEEETDTYIGVLVLVCHFATYLTTWGLTS